MHIKTDILEQKLIKKFGNVNTFLSLVICEDVWNPAIGGWSSFWWENRFEIAEPDNKVFTNWSQMYESMLFLHQPLHLANYK